MGNAPPPKKPPSAMANEAAKKRVIKNREVIGKYRLVLLGANALYVLYRVVYLWASFSLWHMGGFALLLAVYGVVWFMLTKAAEPVYAPLKDGGALISGGDDLDQEGVIEYCWDMLFLAVFVQLGTGFLSDWLWLVYTVPPAIGLYYLWVKIIYPWISKPDEDPNAGQEPKMKMKKGR